MQLPLSWQPSASARALANQKVLDFLRPLKTQIIRKNANNTRNNMKSQIKNKKNGREITNTNIKQNY